MTVYVYRCGNPYVRGALVALLAVIAASLWVPLPGRPLGPILPLAFSALAIFNVWFWLFRVTYELRLEGDSLHCETPVGSRTIDVAGITAIRSGRVDAGVAVIESRAAPPVWVSAARSLGELVDKVRARNGGMTVDIGRSVTRFRRGSCTSVEAAAPQ